MELNICMGNIQERDFCGQKISQRDWSRLVKQMYSSSLSPAAHDPVRLNSFCSLCLSQVMETKDMLYIVTEYAKNGEMFGERNVK